jgi:hypothetical protein
MQYSARMREKVIAEFRRCGRVDMACASAGIDPVTHYRWMQKDAEYQKAFEEARQQVAGILEDEAVRRAYRGTLKPISIGGKMVLVTEFSDRLLEFLLKCRNRPVFGDRQDLQITGKDGTPLIPIGAIDSLLHGKDEE